MNQSHLNYLNKYGSKDMYEIPSCLEKIQLEKNKKFNCRVVSIYDPSKFWIVINFKELECFQILLFRFYYRNFEKYKIPIHKIRQGLYCVAYTCSNYYRGIIVKHTDCETKLKKVKIYFFDYGLMEMIEASKLFYISENFIKVPKFAVRATLFGICPLQTDTWTKDDLYCFSNLVFNRNLEGTLVEMHYPWNILEIRLNTKEEPITFIHKELSFCYVNEKIEENATNGFLYLFPSFEALENGFHPFNLVQVELLAQFTKHNDFDKSCNGKESLIKALENF